MHVLIADPLPPETQAGLEALGLQVTVNTELGSHNLPAALADVDLLVVGRTRVTRRAIEAAPRLRVILRAGSGVETLDLAAASERGVYVSHCPDADASARAEHVFALLLALDRGLAARPLAAPATGLRGRTLGLLGYDATAQRVRDIAVGLGMRVHAHSAALTTARASEAGVRRAATVEALLSEADVVSLHPEAADAGVLLTAERLSLLSAGATLINVARRGLIAWPAAQARLAAGTLRLGLDVYDADDFGDEVPFAADAYPGLLVTHRRASATAQATDAIASTVLDHVEQYLISHRVPDCVNLGAPPEASTTLLCRFRPSNGLLAALFEALRDGGVHVHSVDTGTFRDHAAAYARLELDRAPAPAVLQAITRHPQVIGIDLS